MNNDLILDVMDVVTISLGKSLWCFSQTTSVAFETREVKCEYTTRIHWKVCNTANRMSSTLSPNPTTIASPCASVLLPSYSQANQSSENANPELAPIWTWKHVRFNLNTYKIHSLADYVRTIRCFSTADSYSTELVSWIFYFMRGVFHYTLF